MTKRLIIVLGMHRSGTSAITRGLEVLGASLGEKLMPPAADNKKGYFEDTELNSLNIDLLKSVDNEWFGLTPISATDVDNLRSQGHMLRAVDLMREKINSTNVFAFKDPRVAKLLPFWNAVTDHLHLDVSYVIALRNPLSVVQSLSKRDGFIPERSYFLWLGHLLESLRGSTGKPRIVVDYDRLILSPDIELSRIAGAFRLNVNAKDLGEYKNKFLDTDLRHTAYSPNDLLLDAACPPIVREVFNKLLSVASDQINLDDPTLLSELSGWTIEFDRLKSALRLADQQYKQIASLNQAVTERDGQIASLRSVQHELNLIHLSTTWRVTAPLRRGLTKWPAVRTLARRTVKGSYWTFTGQIFSRLAERRKALAVIQARQMPDNVEARYDHDQASKAPPEAARPVEIDYSIAVPFKFSTSQQRDQGRIGAIVHLYYEDLAGELRAYLGNIPGAVDVYLSTADDFRAAVIEKAFTGWNKGAVQVRVVKNRGRDVAPKLVSFKDVYDHHEYILHFHGKRSEHADVLEHWRHFLLENLIGTSEVVRSVLYAFDRNPKLGIVAAQHFEPMRHWTNWGGNFPMAAGLANRMGFSIDEHAPLDFPSGSMFWARTAALKPLLDLNLRTEDFDEETNQKDSTLAHAIERLFFYVAERAGFDWVKISRPEIFEHTPAIIEVENDTDLDEFFERYTFRLLNPKGVAPRLIMPTPITAPSARLLEHVQKRALGEHLHVPLEMKVTIGIVAYNNKPEDLNLSVAAAFAALIQAGLPSHEAVYLLDNGESTAGAFDNDKYCVRLPSTGNVGFGSGHNELMRAAFENHTDVYIALNPDGLLHPDAVKFLIQMVEANGRRALVEALQFPSEHPKPYDPYTFDTPWVSGACLAIPRSAYADLSGFDENFFMYCEDVDLAWRAKANGYALKTCAPALFLHHVTNRAMAPHVLQRIFESGVLLARKWGASEFETWLKGEMDARSWKMPTTIPATVPKEWRKVADFSHNFTFAQPRW